MAPTASRRCLLLLAVLAAATRCVAIRASEEAVTGGWRGGRRLVEGREVAVVDWENFQSVGRVSGAGGNLEEGGVLQEAIAARAYQGEIIYFIAEQSFFTVALNYILSLHSVGFAHWLMLAPSQDVCDTFNQALEMVLPGEPSGCVWSQKWADHEGWAHHGLKASMYKKLQILKMHYPAVLLEAGLNVFLTDVDVAFPRNFYVDLKTGRLADKNLICQHDGQTCNLGLVYAQNVQPKGPVAWLFKETVRRILEGLDPHVTIMSRSGKQVPRPKLTSHMGSSDFW